MSRPGLAAFFHARAVAVVGASSDPSKVGGSVLANLRVGGFAGRIVPVNAAHPSVQGLPAARSILDVEGDVDLAVVAVPAPDVRATLEQCVAKGVRGAVVVSSGFREAGDEGARREAELRRWLRDQPLRIVGPNCLGWIRPALGLNLTFAPGMPRRGAIGFFSHSGALCTAILDWSRDHDIGFSLFASLGNQADVTEADLLDALAADPETRVILGYLEGVADGRAFFGALRRAAGQKPCVLLKTGRSAEGARAVSSHTGALAGSDRAFDAAVRQAGAVRVGTLEELFDVARIVDAGRLPLGRRVVLVTNGGGLGVLAADAARDAGLDVAALDGAARSRLATVLPPTASLTNPVDLIGDATPARYGAALEALAVDDASCVVMLAPQAATDAGGVARSILGATRGWTRPILAVFAGGGRVRPGARVLEESGVPCYPFPERAVAALGHTVTLAERSARRSSDAPARVVDQSRAAAAARAALPSQGRLGFTEGARLLAAYAFPALRHAVAATPEDAGDRARELGCPVALKIVSPDIVHKTDVGGVVLGVTSPEQACRRAADLLARVRAQRPDARLDGILVQPMAADATHREMLLGMVRDPQFGPLVMLGFGGVWVELLRDTAVRLAPLDRADACAMLAELRLAPALGAVRGLPPVDREALVDAVCRFARLAADLPELAELEINPLLAGPDGVLAVDVRGTVIPLEGS